ncbi:MAG: hypothetical protein IPJ12_00920 [Betaproteobacteria bacterium]|nr:hypothetical protein [Betaproteobacteria bacterium]
MQVTLTLTTGCSGFVGLDHILISKELKARQKLSSAKGRVEQKDLQVIATSDHCPWVTVLEY